ncbi:MAG: ABC transporter ATP-binding protein [Ruminococcaceae bacterium]|jgi:ABC-2 type transport system ATP-binding protein|nr:ABC transporter ATP-binding protein [Oscillospiraceae bacterium]
MIEVQTLTKRFDGFTALDNLTLTVPDGAIYGLVGPNGSGKSTLLRHVMGIYRQDAGTVLVDGQPVYENPAVKARMAYIPDDVFYFPQAGVRDMMRYYAGIYPGFDDARYEKLKEVFQLDEKMPIRRMSKGMQKQAAFWLAMCQRADYMVLDEPVDGLDPVMRRQIWGLLMADAAERGMTVLVSSHNLRELEDVCDHVGILNHGHLLLERSLSELQENISKVQLALPDGRPLPEGLNLVHETVSGRLRTLIIRGDPEQTLQTLQECEPLFLDAVPLSLEEIFIYELGGADYAVKDILL